MPKLDFRDFITAFRKQFTFQAGKGGKRICKYYTADNKDQGLKNNQWGIMAFIHTGLHYGFSDRELIAELKIRPSLYEVLKDEVRTIVTTDYPDKELRKKILIKTGLVKNCVRCYYGV